MFICERCVARAGGLAAGGAVQDRPDVPMLLEPPGSEVDCSFCGQQARQVRHLVAAGVVRICDRCLDLCEQILAEEASAT